MSRPEVIGEFHYLNGEWWEPKSPHEDFPFSWVWVFGEWKHD